MDWEMVSRCESALSLSSERCDEMAVHCSAALNRLTDKWRVKCEVGRLPRVYKDSNLLVYPVLTRICMFPIREDEEFDEGEAARMGTHRPLFYSEMGATFLMVLNKRLKIRRRSNGKRSKGRELIC